MQRRTWQICQGIDCDAGTSAHYRALWSQPAAMPLERSITLINKQQPGDVLCMTAAIRSLHIGYPGRYRVSVDTLHPEIFAHSPDIVATNGEPIQMHYPAIHCSTERCVHFMQAWCEHLSEALHIPIPLAVNTPSLYFSEAVVVNDYWIVCSDTSNFTAKRWNSWQSVVDAMPHIRFLQVGLAGEPLRGVTNAIGQTSTRELFELVRGCRGVLCGVGFLMHIAAALEKPAVVIAGGREPVQWNAYPKQHYLHTIGELPCAKPCWIARMEECAMPVGSVAKCMTLVSPASVATLIERLNSRSIEYP